VANLTLIAAISMQALPASPGPVVMAFVFTLLGPALLAMWLRRRSERLGSLQSASVWVHWILIGAWLYWISAVSVTDLSAFAIRLQFQSMVLTFLIGSALFALPPLLASASCIAILTYTADPHERPGAFRLVARSMSREAVMLVPFGMLLVGGAMFDQSHRVSMASIPTAWFTYKLLSWCVGHWSSGRIQRITQGSIVETAEVIARRAGVALGGLYLVANRSAREANAFVTRGNVLAITRGLVERLTRRELTAVIGHEVAHLRGKHVGWRLAAFWGYMLVIGPMAPSLIHHYHLPVWLLTLPVLPLGYILATSLLSRRHEFAADAAAVELAGDPEGMIAALARISRMTRTPVNWGGIQGAILSHPSMRQRVLAIAKRFGVAKVRALALLQDPDLLAGASAPEELRFEIPPECGAAEPMFSSRSKAAYQLWSRWAANAVLVGATLAFGILGLPLIVWAYLGFAEWLDRLYFRYLRWRLGAGDGEFVGLIPPGEGGFCPWDIGFLRLGPNGLEYAGERTRFALAWEAVRGIEIGEGPLAWRRAYGVVIRTVEGDFVLTTPDRGLSRRNAGWLLARLEAWGVGCGRPLQTWRFVPQDGIVGHLARAGMLLVGLALLWPASSVSFLAAAAYLVAVSPSFISPRPDSGVQKEDATPVPVAGAALR
jgi:Zn-dependent protease with chaperone function